MKKYAFLIFISFLFLNCDTGKTGGTQDTEIYLNLIKDIGPGEQIKNCVQFSDNRGSTVSLVGFPEYYLTKVNAGKKVSWMSHPDSKTKIEIIEVNFIRMQNNQNILTSDHQRNKNGMATAEVKKKGEVENLTNHYYEVSFSINHKVFMLGSILQFHED